MPGVVWGDVKAKSLQKPAIYIPNPFDALEQWERERYYTLSKELLDPELPRRHSASSLAREGTAVLSCQSNHASQRLVLEENQRSCDAHIHFYDTANVSGSHLPATSTPAQWGQASTDESDLDFQRLPRKRLYKRNRRENSVVSGGSGNDRSRRRTSLSP